MKIHLKLILLLTLPLFSFAQSIDYQISLSDALKRSKQVRKPLFLLVEMSPLSTTSSTGNYLNRINQLNDPEVVKKFNKNFVSFKTTRSDTSIAFLLKQYNINVFPSFLFLHANKDLFYKDFGNATSNIKYLKMADEAVKASELKSLSVLQQEYLSNQNDENKLKTYIDRRKQLGITDNAALIEAYVSNLKIKDLNSYPVVLYILEAGPYADGIAYRLAYNNRKIIDSIYKNEPLDKRIGFNNLIINNTLKNAIRAKNKNRAIAAASFARNIWAKDYQNGYKAYFSELLKYYSAVKDTAEYLSCAATFYDQYYMNISADSIKKSDAKKRQEMLVKSRPANDKINNLVSKDKLDSLSRLSSKTVTYSRLVGVTSGPVNSYATELNNAAYNFYTIGTKNMNYLTKAMLWSKRSIELNSVSSYYDTLAHILYRLGFYQESISTQEEAIEKAKQEKISLDTLQQELIKIKNKQL